MIWLRRVVAYADGVVAMGIKRLAETGFGLDAVVTQKLVQLLEDYLHARAELLGRRRLVAG